MINVRVVAVGLLEMDEIRKNTEALIAAPCCTGSKAADIDVDMLVNEIVKRLQAI